MKLQANIVRVTGATIHRRARLEDGVVVPGGRVATPVRVEIEQASSGFFLFHYDDAGRCIADTWHATLTDAKEQAKFEFGIDDSGWIEIAD